MNVPHYLDSVPRRKVLISYGGIDRRPINRALTRWTDKTSQTTLDGLAEAIVTFARSPEPGIAYAYWPAYDGLSHRDGWRASAPAQHFIELDRALGGLADRLRGTGTTLLLSADHGFVDIEPERTIELREVPGFRECLATAPSGDARQVSCFVRPRMVKRFEHIVSEHLGHACVAVFGQDLLEAGAFGPGVPHPALLSRLGDYVLLAREGYALGYRPPGQERPHPRGQHGGLTEPEMLVPFYALGPFSE